MWPQAIHRWHGLFSTVRKFETTTNNLNGDLEEISKWAFQWKRSFNLDFSKKVQELIFRKKTHKASHSQVFFNHILVSQVSCQNHLGLILDSKLKFDVYIKSIVAKVNKGIDLIRVLPRPSLGMIYKDSIRSHLDDRDMFDQTFHDSFHQKIESAQYDVALAITWTIRGTSKTLPGTGFWAFAV